MCKKDSGIGHIDLIEFFKNPNWARIMANSKKPAIVELKKRLVFLTSFLPKSTKIKQRSWHILNDTYELLLCESCSNPVKYNNGSGYARFCSKKCSANAETSKQKVKETNLKRYGAEYGMQVSEIKNKVESTNMKKYGGKSSLSSKNTRDKVKKTLIEKYGKETPFEIDTIREKRAMTMLEKYGTVHALQNEESVEKMHSTMQNTYGVLHALQNPELKEEFLKTTRKRFDRDHAKQSHIRIDILDMLDNEELLRRKHYDEKLSVMGIAKELGVSEGCVKSRLDRFGIESTIHPVSDKEIHFKKFLEDKHISVNVNDRMIISPRELDFYFPDNGFAVEFNGLYWHSEHHKPKLYHLEKYSSCKERGVRLFQFFEDEVHEKGDIIKKKVLYESGQLEEKVYARNCEISKISANDKNLFLDKHHIQGGGDGSVNYGLYSLDNLVAVIGLKRYKNNTFLLNRFATSCVVVGGFSKLLKHVERNHPEIKQMVTFADLRYSSGELYFNTGFKLDKILKPDYYWVKNMKRWHKFNFRHNTGLKDLKNYDPASSETENMHKHGFYRVYDAGKMRFIKTFGK